MSTPDPSRVAAHRTRRLVRVVAPLCAAAAMLAATFGWPMYWLVPIGAAIGFSASLVSQHLRRAGR